ncbi:MAG: Crp/Fnr family transcriptional regulator [Dongiaceae bacterium]
MKVLHDSLLPENLSSMELFTGLPREALAEVAGCARLRRLAKDTIVFAQGARAGHCHALAEGRVRITQSDENGAQLVVRFIGRGEMFGTVALFTDGRYPAEAKTVTDSIEVRWTEPVLLDLIRRHPQIALNIITVLGGRVRDVQERLREVATQRVECRIANVLLRLADRAGHPAGDGTTIGFPLTRRDLAEMCGSTLHTVSRILTAWEKAALIATKRQRITIRRRDAIRRIAEDPTA